MVDMQHSLSIITIPYFHSKNVPFAIPVRKTTPVKETLQVSDEGGSTPTIRSRSSTIEGNKALNYIFNRPLMSRLNNSG